MTYMRSTEAVFCSMPAQPASRTIPRKNIVFMKTPLLSQRRHVEARTGRVLVRPACGYGLGARVELHPFGAVHVQVAEERILPAAERVERHRHRDRHVDADHPHLDLGREAP